MSAMPNVAAPLIMVLWLDSSGQDGWRAVQEARELPTRSMQCLSVGWLLHEDKEAIVLAPHASMDRDRNFDSVRGHLAIPRVAVLRVQTVRRANAGSRP